MLVHGIGLGAWLWEPWMPAFAQAGLRTLAVSLGTENRSFVETVAAVERVLDGAGERPLLVGHSRGGLVAQTIAARRPLAGLALICPLPPGQIQVWPPMIARRRQVGLVAALASGRPARVSWPLYRQLGLDRMDEDTAKACYARTLPWSARLAIDLALRRPVVDVRRVTAPVLVCIGKEDRLVPWQKARMLADLYDAVTWRYDTLGHMPPYEPGGERMGTDLAGWLAAPTRPEVLESEGFAPNEGVGHALRAERRGEAARRRSAYGQKRSGRA